MTRTVHGVTDGHGPDVTGAGREFVANADAPTAARSYVVSVITPLLPAAWPPMLRDDLELVVSELVTNAVRAASPIVRVHATYERNRIVVGVEDRGAGWPEQREAGIHDTTGRGLALVSALCVAWGVRLSGPERKTVWAELEVPPG